MKVILGALAVALLLGWAEQQYVRELPDTDLAAAQAFVTNSPEIAAKLGAIDKVTFARGSLNSKTLSQGFDDHFSLELHGDRGQGRLEVGVTTWNARQAVTEARLDDHWLPVAGQ